MEWVTGLRRYNSNLNQELALEDVKIQRPSGGSLSTTTHEGVIRIENAEQ